MKLCLGTVQFGVDYGIHGKRKPSVEDSVSLLSRAVRLGIDAFDTSALYGDAESVLGRFLEESDVDRRKLFIVSKFGTKEFEGLSAADCVSKLQEVVRGTLSRVGTDYLDAYICHVPSAVRDDRVIQAMRSLKEEGLARRIGFSVYETEEAELAVKSGSVDFLQVPFSVLDQRMFQSGILDLAAREGVQLHSRSAFVQGLALMSEREVPDHLSEIRPLISRFDRLSSETGVARRDVALAFVRGFHQISHLVFGVHDGNQLEENVRSFDSDVPADVIQAAQRIFEDVDPSLVMPNKWRR